MLISIGLTLFAVFLWYKAVRSRKIALAVSTLTFLSLLFIGIYYAADYLTGAGIDESILFHLRAGMKGAGYADFRVLGLLGLLYLLASAIVSFGVYRVSLRDDRADYERLRIGAGIFAVLLAFIANPATLDLEQLYNISKPVEAAVYGDLPLPDGYVEPGEIRLGEKPKNIVYLYLESLEGTYLDESVFPGLMPNLRELEKQAVSFTNVQQVYNTGWTMAGMTASQCGIPLLTPSRGNNMSGMDQFLPGAKCLGDILDSAGYQLNYMGGAKLDFGGKGRFYATHGFDRVEGYDELEYLLEDPSYTSPWGLYDDTLLNAAKRRYDDLSATGEPFGLFVLTVDTHHPNGHVAKACGDTEYGDGSNSILNVLRCADIMVSDFIEYVMESEGFEDTILVVSSDHLAMRNTAWDKLERGERRNLFMVFGSDLPAEKVSTPGSTLDVAPTLLNIMGSDTQAYGFGRNLLGEAPTLAGRETPVDEVLGQSRDYLSLLWSIPQLNNGIRVVLDEQQLVLGKRTLRFPALFTLEDDLGVKEIRFDIYKDQPLDEALFGLAYDQRFLWIDRCAIIGNLDASAELTADGYCVAFGATGATSLDFSELVDGMKFSLPDLKKIFDGMEFSQKTSDSRLAFLDLARRYERGTVVQYQPRKVLDGRFMIRSAGFGTGPSSVGNLKQQSTVQLVRGLTVVGFDADFSPVKLGHVDTCAYDGALRDILELDGEGFQAVIERNSDYFGAFAIIAHDSALCEEKYDFSSLFEGTGLQRWKQIGFRTPYIGLIAGNGDTSEYLGETETAIVVEAVDFIRPPKRAQQRLLTELPRIAHGGGGFNGASYSNSIDALKQNRDDYELFEVDLSWTSDNELVCIHDWEDSLQRVFNLEGRDKVTLSEFENLIRTKSPVQKCTLETLAEWMKANDSKRVIPDIKERNLEAWEKISSEYPELRDRFVPQIYIPENYRKLRDLGFENIVWTLYRFDQSDEEVLRWLKFMDLFGLAMPIERAERELAIRAREETGVLSWVYTVNTPEELDKMRALGIVEIFTDWLPSSGLTR